MDRARVVRRDNRRCVFLRNEGISADCVNNSPRIIYLPGQDARSLPVSYRQQFCPAKELARASIPRPPLITTTLFRQIQSYWTKTFAASSLRERKDISTR
jgi:hypothetical protein